MSFLLWGAVKRMGPPKYPRCFFLRWFSADSFCISILLYFAQQTRNLTFETFILIIIILVKI